MCSVSGLPVVNDRRELVGALSDRDVRAIVERQPDLELKKPVTDFLNDLYREENVLLLSFCSFPRLHHCE